MTLAIAKTKFTADADVSKVRTALSSIPEPQHSTEMPADLTPDNAVIALQREIVALDLIHMPPTVQYTGTKNLVTCVYARIYNDEQELGIHVDSVIAPLDISSMLEHFRRKDNLKVMLIGGVPGGDSELILNYLLTSLINASEVMTVTCQKLLVRNQPKEITDRVFMRDFITRKAALLYRRLFEKELDIGKISTYPLSYFQDSTTIDETFNTWGQKDRDVMDKGVVCIAESFLILNEYVKVENIKKLDNILIRIRSYIKNEEDFHRYFKV